MTGYDGRGAQFPLTIPRGSDVAFTVTATDSNSAAIDLAGATITGNVYNTAGTVAVAMTDAVSGAGNNIITLSLSDTQTTALTATSYRWALTVTRGTDTRYWLAGPVTMVDASIGRTSNGANATLVVDEDVNILVTVAAVGEPAGNGAPPVTVTGATDTLTSTDNGRFNVYTNAGGATVTIPTDAADDLPDGFECILFAAGAGGLSLDTTGVTLEGSAPTTTTAQNGSIYVKKTATANTWVVIAGTATGGTGTVNTFGTPVANDVARFVDADTIEGRSYAELLSDLSLDSSLTTFALPDSTTISTFGASLIDDTSAQVATATLRTAPATVTGTTDTLAAGDDATVILYTASGAVTVTLANIATGFEAVLVCLGAGGLSVAAGGMSFANSFTPKLTVAQGEALFVKQTAASTWIVLGGTAT